MTEDSRKAKLREATVAGIFYPDEPDELRARIGTLLDAANPDVKAAAAIVSPHAGLDYSGDLAALAWKSAAGRQVKTVLALSPFHRAEESLVYLPEADSFETPLGSVEVDKELVEELGDCGTIFSMNDIPHFEEHGIEVQLPFMQVMFPRAKLVPLLVGKPSLAMVKALGAALGLVFGPRTADTLAVVSADLAAGPSGLRVKEEADLLIEAMIARDARGVLEAGSMAEAPACAANCIAAFVDSPLSAGLEVRILGRHDSSRARQSGDERLVEYIAAAFAQAGARP